MGAGWGVVNKDNYEITYQKIRIKNLPQVLKGTTITLVSDFHSGPYLKEDALRDYKDIINDLKSDLILIPGDITNSNTDEAVSFANAFKDVKAKYGIYASLGNHDYFSDPNAIAEIVDNNTPIKVLRNNSKIIKVRGKEICILGIEDTRGSGGGYDSIIMNYFNETINKTRGKLNGKFDTTPKILLYHKPYLFKDIKDKKIDLMMSGHTHGGQIVLAKFGNINLSMAAAVSNYVSGLYKEGDSQMYVSRGVGCVALPMRLNCPPEITQITLI
jgi:predicted MPP superfamily phosphohydrolase